MEIILILFTVISLFGLIISIIEKHKGGIIAFSSLFISLIIVGYSYTSVPKNEKIIPLTELTTETGVIVKGYYLEPHNNAFVMTPNHVNYVKITYPRGGSVSPITYELLTELEQPKTNE
jgi:hypothetical protein